MTSIRERALDQYRKQSKLGEGTYGVVFKAIDTETNETVALKKIRIDDDDEGIPSTAIREVALLKDLNHKNIVSLLHVIFHRTQLYLVFEYLPYDLKKYMIANQNRLSVETIQSFSYQLLEAMDYCHKQRVLHRDLKPQNILVGTDGTIKLADFGLARAFCLPNRTWTHEVITLWYRPPEILLGTQTYTVTADMWSLGTIMIEMMNGSPLFHGDSEICQLMHIFKAIGTPTESKWEGVTKLKDFQSNFPLWKGKPWDELVSDPYCNDLGRNLLSMLVALDPSQRITAKQALKHPYFNDYIQKQNGSTGKAETGKAAVAAAPPSGIKKCNNNNNNSNNNNNNNENIAPNNNSNNNRSMGWRQVMPNSKQNNNNNNSNNTRDKPNIGDVEDSGYKPLINSNNNNNSSNNNDNSDGDCNNEGVLEPNISHSNQLSMTH